MWNRVFRAHKLTLAALWTVLWPKIVTWMEDNNHADETDVLDHLVGQLVASLKVGATQMCQSTSVCSLHNVRNCVRPFGNLTAQILTIRLSCFGEPTCSLCLFY